MTSDVADWLEEERLIGGFRGGQGCTLGRFIAGLPAEERSVLNDALTGEKYNNATIVRTLARMGAEVGKDGIRNHRVTVRGGSGCSCRKAGLL